MITESTHNAETRHNTIETENQSGNKSRPNKNNTRWTSNVSNPVSGSSSESFPPILGAKIGIFKEGVQFLELSGFERVERGDFLVLHRDKVDMKILRSAGRVLHSAITNPFFGLLSKFVLFNLARTNFVSGPSILDCVKMAEVTRNGEMCCEIEDIEEVRSMGERHARALKQIRQLLAAMLANNPAPVALTNEPNMENEDAQYPGNTNHDSFRYNRVEFPCAGVKIYRDGCIGVDSCSIMMELQRIPRLSDAVLKQLKMQFMVHSRKMTLRGSSPKELKVVKDRDVEYTSQTHSAECYDHHLCAIVLNLKNYLSSFTEIETKTVTVRGFIRGYGVIDRLLYNLFKKGTDQWTKEAEKFFWTFKKPMIMPPVLALPNFTKEFFIEKDICDEGIRVVFMQRNHPLTFYSKDMKLQHARLSVYKKEMLAVVADVKKKATLSQPKPGPGRGSQNCQDDRPSGLRQTIAKTIIIEAVWPHPSQRAMDDLTNHRVCEGPSLRPSYRAQEQKSPVRIRLDYYTALRLTSYEGSLSERLDQSRVIYSRHGIDTLPAEVTGHPSWEFNPDDEDMTVDDLINLANRRHVEDITASMNRNMNKNLPFRMRPDRQVVQFDLDVDKIDRVDATGAIIPPTLEPGAKLNITTTMIQLLHLKGMFSGLAGDNPNMHLVNFINICKSFDNPGVGKNAIRL
ncbi:hypothetical protein FXO38_14124 [Capsicum annuum]|nr:hypothetical protein FXO38_14124 [Capsicum annuum]